MRKSLQNILSKLLILFLLASTLQIDRAGFVLEDSEASDVAVEDSDDLEEFDSFDMEDTEIFNISNFHLGFYQIFKKNLSIKDKEHIITMLDTAFIPPEV
ncbi:hypothetical protein EGI22_08185 [Lacihabitans sp. LS3-19]|uniref:hypothetical protein n=1 Tax=Lacihabitans sp. LS3-19 TaxID=2487335 RepID=UPI0020CE84BA|nr:hypothetical protein [Lacihabitans sp. LS3-19]MCP9767888.1 hypothetical protein [Lacihabitans sp. LS3-19]